MQILKVWRLVPKRSHFPRLPPLEIAVGHMGVESDLRELAQLPKRKKLPKSPIVTLSLLLHLPELRGRRLHLLRKGGR